MLKDFIRATDDYHKGGQNHLVLTILRSLLVAAVSGVLIAHGRRGGSLWPAAAIAGVWILLEVAWASTWSKRVARRAGGTRPYQYRLRVGFEGIHVDGARSRLLLLPGTGWRFTVKDKVWILRNEEDERVLALHADMFGDEASRATFRQGLQDFAASPAGPSPNP